jgi:hypothetical protein
MIEAILKLYPQIAVIRGETAYDADGNEVAYDLQAVNAKVAADEQAAATAKTAALAKLTALGLTTADLTALGL